ncbi:MAG: nitroreductase [Acidimicrobiales bacterium]
MSPDPDIRAAPAAFESFVELARRRRTPLLCDAHRPVADELIEQLVDLVRWAPSHKRTWPWRVTVVTDDGRRHLGEALATDMVGAGWADDHPKVRKTRVKYTRAAVVLVIGAAPHEDPRLRMENRYAVAAGIQNLLLGATATGLAAFWGSPPPGEHGTALAVCGLPPDTEIVGLVYLGWPTATPPTPERPVIRAARLS